MAFETPRTFRIPKGRGLPEAMNKLSQALRVEPESRIQLEALGVTVPSQSSATGDSRNAAGSASPGKTGESAEDIYRRVLERGGSFTARRIDDASLLSRQYSLSSLRMNLEECRTVVAFLQNGPQRIGRLAGLKNGITRLTRVALNWFIAPSVIFDKAAGEALNECAASLDLLSRQVQVIAQELAVLSETTKALEVSLTEMSRNSASMNRDT